MNKAVANLGRLAHFYECRRDVATADQPSTSVFVHQHGDCKRQLHTVLVINHTLTATKCSQFSCKIFIFTAQASHQCYLHRCTGVMVDYRTRNWEVVGLMLTQATTSNLKQAANLLCAQANSASYSQWHGEWVVSYPVWATGQRPRVADWESGVC